MMHWYRWDHGTVTDPRFAVVALRAEAELTQVIAVWALIQEDASAAEERGRFSLDAVEIAMALRMGEGDAESILHGLRQRGMIDGDRVVGFEDRNPVSTDRVRRHRERKRAEKLSENEASETHETPMKQVKPFHAFQPRFGNTHETGETPHTVHTVPSLPSLPPSLLASRTREGDAPAQQEGRTPRQPRDPADAPLRVRLVVAANQGVEAGLGREPTRPLLAGHPDALALAEHIESALIDPALALATVFDVASRYAAKHSKPPGSMAYFKRAIDAAQDTAQIREATASTERPSLAGASNGQRSASEGFLALAEEYRRLEEEQKANETPGDDNA